MSICQFSTSINVTDTCTPDTGPPVPVQWNGAAQPARVRIKNYQDFANALAACPTCVFQGFTPPVWDGTFPVQYAPDNFTLKWFTAGSIPPAISSNYYLASTNNNFLIDMQVYFVTGQHWTLAINCFDSGGVILPNPVWFGWKTTGLTAVSENGTYMLMPGSLSGLPACLHLEAY